MRLWYTKDQYHREDGPALEHFSKNGQRTSTHYYLNGASKLEKEYHRIIALQKLSANHATDETISL
jgi:hypothetical protein